MAFSTLNFKAWIDENRHLLRPPVGNKCIWPDGEFIVMVVGGPNERDDFHVNGTPEFFYQIEGNATLRLRNENGSFEDIKLNEGEIFLLPSNVPHSPQREANTIGLVIEQKRPEGINDGLQWFCRNCGNKLYEEFFVLKNVEADFPPVFERFWSNEDLRTCNSCGTKLERRK